VTCSCGAETDVKETRKRPDGSLRRRRKCRACGAMSTTIEQIVHTESSLGPWRTGNAGTAHVYLTTKDERKTIRAALKVLARLVDKTREDSP
jgi:hypothetical protein